MLKHARRLQQAPAGARSPQGVRPCERATIQPCVDLTLTLQMLRRSVVVVPWPSREFLQGDMHSNQLVSGLKHATKRLSQHLSAAAVSRNMLQTPCPPNTVAAAYAVPPCAPCPCSQQMQAAHRHQLRTPLQCVHTCPLYSYINPHHLGFIAVLAYLALRASCHCSKDGRLSDKVAEGGRPETSIETERLLGLLSYSSSSVLLGRWGCSRSPASSSAA